VISGPAVRRWVRRDGGGDEGRCRWPPSPLSLPLDLPWPDVCCVGEEEEEGVVVAGGLRMVMMMMTMMSVSTCAAGRIYLLGDKRISYCSRSPAGPHVSCRHVDDVSRHTLGRGGRADICARMMIDDGGGEWMAIVP
jgi:hypothetical protein